MYIIIQFNNRKGNWHRAQKKGKAFRVSRSQVAFKISSKHLSAVWPSHRAGRDGFVFSPLRPLSFFRFLPFVHS